MSISALSDATKRLLGSPLIVSTPVTLVKELLDNAIDAKATSVEVLISCNTIDKIEVRDNGTGIHLHDYESLAKPGHTSKLRTFEELKTLGGTTLGFRGEALASANALAKITITTKTVTEPVATILQIAPKTGGAVNPQSGSAPAGTTVTVTSLYDEFPVRKQTAVRESAKSLESIKDLLKSYAMARPQLKLMLKILKNPKFNWAYAPRKDADSIEPLLQLFGAGVASACFHKSGDRLGLVGEDRVTQSQDGHPTKLFFFDALLMKPDSGSHYPKHHYISVDHRPISHSSRTAKKLVSVYQRYVKCGFGKNIVPSDLFICLNVDCPAGSYDINVEPSKNDILFGDENSLLKQFECFCEEVYAPPTSINIGRTSQCRVLSEPSSVDDATLPAEVQSSGFGARGDDSSSDPRHAVQPNVDSITTQPAVIGEPPKVTPENRVLNLSSRPVRRRSPTLIPSIWTAINAPLLQDGEAGECFQNYGHQHDRQPLRTFQERCDMSNDLGEQTNEYHGRRKPVKQSQPMHHQCKTRGDSESTPVLSMNPWSITQDYHQQARAGVMSQFEARAQDHTLSDAPCHRVMTPEPNILRHFAAPPRDLDVPPSLTYPSINGHALSMSEVVPGGPYRSPMSSPAMIAQNPGLRPRHASASSQRHARPRWTPPPSVQKHHDSYCRSSRLVLPDGLKQTTLSFGATQPQRPSGTHSSNEALKQTHANDVVCSTTRPCPPRNTDHQHDHENALRGSVSGHKAHNQQAKDQNTCTPFTILHVTDLNPNEQHLEDTEPVQTSLPTGDPRAYLLRRQKSVIGGGQSRTKLRRIKSNLMPLENIPTGDQTHDLVTTSDVDVQHLSRLTKESECYDRYIVEGDIPEGLDMNLEEGRRVEARLNNTLACCSKALADLQTNMRIRLCDLLKGKGTTTRVSRVV